MPFSNLLMVFIGFCCSNAKRRKITLSKLFRVSSFILSLFTKVSEILIQVVIFCEEDFFIAIRNQVLEHI